MSNFSRAARRKAKRNFGLNSDEAAEKALEVCANERAIIREQATATKILEIAVPKLKKEMQQEAWGNFLVLFAGWLRVSCGFGKKRIARYFESFTTWADDMTHEQPKIDDIIQMLMDETGYDFMAHAQKIEDAAKAEAV